MPPTSWITLAGRFDLGAVRGTPAYVARGAMGEIWRLETDRGRWAVKWQFPWAPPDARPYDLEVQRAAAAGGIPLAPPVTTPAGEAVIQVGDRQARVRGCLRQIRWRSPFGASSEGCGRCGLEAGPGQRLRVRRRWCR